MKFTLKPHQLLAHWMPGFTVIAIFFLDDLYNGRGRLKHLMDAIPPSQTAAAEVFDKAIVILAFTAVAFALGQVLDACRNILEWLIDRSTKWEVPWDKIMVLDAQRLQCFDDHYFAAYAFDANLAIGFFVLLLFRLSGVVSITPGYSYGILIVMVVLVLDAIGLRLEIKSILEKAQEKSSSTPASTSSEGAEEDTAE